jgi:hypothetical protein
MIEHQTHAYESDNAIELLHRCSYYPATGDVLSTILYRSCYSPVLPCGRSSSPYVVVQILLSIDDNDTDIDDSDDGGSDDDSIAVLVIAR